MRLDGSSKISDRRDMVADFQTRWEKFLISLNAYQFFLICHNLFCFLLLGPTFLSFFSVLEREVLESI